MLLERHLVAKEPPRPNPPRFPGFDEAQSCMYHMGEKGHHVDNCLILKRKIQALIDGGVLEFDKEEPNVQQNPLPDHGRVNAIWDDSDTDELECVADTAKLQEVLGLAATYPADREASKEEKMECVAKLAALGIIDQAGGPATNGTPSRIDLSSSEFRMKADDGSLEEATCEHRPNEKRVAKESVEELDDEEVRRRKAHQADKEFLRKALARGDVVDTLGQDSGGYNYRVLYSPPPWVFVKTEEVVPDGWGGMDDPVDEGELVGAIDEATPSYVSKEHNLGTQERLASLERSMDRMASMASELFEMVANTRVPPVEGKYELLELRKTVKWQNRRLAELEEHIRDLASAVSELKAVVAQRGMQPQLSQSMTFPRKFGGEGCPLNHISYYLNRMVGYHEDDQVLINGFEHSLIGPALHWYRSIDFDWIPNLEDLERRFLQRFEANLKPAVTKDDLMHITMEKGERFETFAHRWRLQANQILPPLAEREMVELFVRTLPQEYRERINAYGFQFFSHVVSIGLRHESVIRRSKYRKEKGPDQTGISSEPWCHDYDSDHIDVDELIAAIGSKAPFVIKLDEVNKREDVESTSSDRVTISLSGLELEDKKARLDGGIEKVVIKIPPPADYNPKAVPWDYGTGEIDAVMRSGRCYAPREGEPEKREVSREDAERALSIVRTSEFEVIEQLRKMPAQISLLDLFTNSEKHKNALMKVLNEVQVPETINEVQLEDFVGSILIKDQISFSDEDIPVDGWAHNKALYISTRSHGKQISHVLIDNGSAFNICPLATLRNLGVNEELIRTSKATIRAFDGMRKSVVGEIELDVFIGPVEFSIGFQVMDLPSAFGLLLGRPWIHTAGAVPSSLHQKVRFVIDGKVITVHGEMDFATYQKSAVPYVEPESKEEASYHSFEVVAVTHALPGAKRRVPTPSQYTLAPGRMLLIHGFIPGRGLGKDGQGIRSPLQLATNERRTGLGYTGGSSRGFASGGRGRGKYGGRGGRRGRGSSFIGSREWKGQASRIGSPLDQYFSGRPKMLADETIQNTPEPDLSNPFLEDTVNVIIEQLDEDSSPSV